MTFAAHQLPPARHAPSPPGLAYPRETFDELLDARAVFAWQRGDGEWVIGAFTSQRVYEFA